MEVDHNNIIVKSAHHDVQRRQCEDNGADPRCRDDLLRPSHGAPRARFERVNDDDEPAEETN